MGEISLKIVHFSLYFHNRLRASHNSFFKISLTSSQRVEKQVSIAVVKFQIEVDKLRRDLEFAKMEKEYSRD